MGLIKNINEKIMKMEHLKQYLLSDTITKSPVTANDDKGVVWLCFVLFFLTRNHFALIAEIEKVLLSLCHQPHINIIIN